MSYLHDDEHRLTHRYWAFSIEPYYPSGGLSDITMTTDALSDIEWTRVDYVLDTKTMLTLSEKYGEWTQP